jgi:hypothetical protein
MSGRQNFLTPSLCKCRARDKKPQVMPSWLILPTAHHVSISMWGIVIGRWGGGIKARRKLDPSATLLTTNLTQAARALNHTLRPRIRRLTGLQDGNLMRLQFQRTTQTRVCVLLLLLLTTTSTCDVTKSARIHRSETRYESCSVSCGLYTAAFWVLAPWSIVGRNQHFTGTRRFYLQSIRLQDYTPSTPPPQTTIHIFTGMKTSNPQLTQAPISAIFHPNSSTNMR